MADANALTWLGINSCIAVVLAPIGAAIKNAGINNNAKTILGLLINGIKQQANKTAVAITPINTRPLVTPFVFNLSAYQPPHNTPNTEPANNINPKLNPALSIRHPKVRLK